MIQLEKLTSSNVIIKWNNITFSGTGSKSSADAGTNKPYYKLAYWLKSSPENSIKHDQLYKNELKLTDLKPNSDYIVQIVAINGPMSTDVSLKYFHTLVDDIKVPSNLELNRYEADKLRIKWDPVVLTDPHQQVKSKQKNLIAGYKIYYKELVPNSAEGEDYAQDSSDFDLNGSDEWKYERQSGMTEVVLDGLNINSDYAIKVTAVDTSNNEGPESDTKVAARLISTDEDENGDKIDVSPVFDPNSLAKNKINEKIGIPRDLEIMEYTSTSVKFSWMPPPPSSAYQIKYFLISYVDRIKYFKESNGTLVSFLSGLAITVKVPARDDPTIKITWLVTSLAANTEYDFNISAVLANMVQGPPIQKMIKTRRDRPIKIDKPTVIEIYTDNTVLIRTGNASEKNGPISKYWLIVTPLSSYAQQQEKQHSQNFETREKDIMNLLRYSVHNHTYPQYFANESTYVAAEFETSHWPQKFILGDGRQYGRFLNRKLVRNMDYKTYITAFTDESVGNQNMLDLSNIFNAKTTEQSTFSEGDLFSSSMYSDMFNTKQFESSHNPIIYNGIGFGDYYNVLWIIGAIASFIFIIILIIVVSVHLMHKKRKTIGTTINNSQMVHTLNTRGTSGGNTMSHNRHQIDTAASINKIGTVTTNTLKQSMNSHQIMSGLKTTNRSSISSSSSTTASPTTALLSCSINNNSSNNVGGGANSQNSNNTNNTNVNSNNILLTNGLLTTASPLHTEINNTTSPISANLLVNPTESLYTSIEVTQKLLQQQLGSGITYDNSQAMMMMLMNNTNSFNSGNANTLTRNSNTLFNTMSHNYDPIEMRRMQFQTQAMQSHPPITIEDMSQHIERLKAQNNAKFSLEYESIEPGQQFQWENSIMDLNRQKNRYANVIAYDHSRVVLTKLPPNCY